MSCIINLFYKGGGDKMGIKEWFIDRSVRKMSREEKQSMMNTMMDKMMEKMFEGMNSADKGIDDSNDAKDDGRYEYGRDHVTNDV